MSSLLSDGHELLQQPLRPLKKRVPDIAFAASDASGWDECLPTVAACTIETPMGVVETSDHGDLWREAWKVTARSPDAVTMTALCRSLPLELTRSIILAPTQRGWRLRLLYSLRNLSRERMPWSWAAHPLFACEAGDRIALPESVTAVRVEDSRGNRVGAHGDWIAWPRGVRAESGAYDLSVAEPSTSAFAEKLFSDRLASGDGWCSLERIGIGLRMTVRFAVETTPYLGLWLCYGGWPDGGDGGRQMCVAMEPSTAPEDALARMGEWSRWIEPGATTHWPLDVEIERLTKMQ